MKWLRFQIDLLSFSSDSDIQGSLAIFMLLEQYGVSSPPYIDRIEMEFTLVGSQILYSLTDKSQCKKNLGTKESTLFSIQNHRRKYDFECPIHWIIKW